MAAHHRREKVCHTRPAYREGRKEKAVKVYTVNKESRYLLIQGVPALKLTKELLDISSLYGAIHEYRLLEDFPDKEEFTQVYWIQYQQLQAAKVAKRKLDDRPFYGGILHVSYAPEYETVDDTRQKLQDRRKAVAKRLRTLEAQKQEELSSGSSVPTSSADKLGVSGTESQNQPASEGENSNQYTIPFTDRTVPEESQSTINPDDSDYLPQLPLPPKVLPRSEWTRPAQPSPEFPRLTTSHATLPQGFNPYRDGKCPTDPYQLTKSASQIQANEIGPQLPTGASSAPRKVLCNKEPAINEDSLVQQSDLRRFSRKRHILDVPQTDSHKRLDTDHSSRKRRALDRCSVPKTHQPARIVQNTAGGVGFMPRQVQTQKRAGDAEMGSEQELRGGLGFMPRQVQAQKRADAEMGPEQGAADNAAGDEVAPDTGNASLDQTVQDVRSRLRAVNEAGASSCQPSRAPSTGQEAAQQAEQQNVPQLPQRPRKTRRKI